MSYIVPDLTVKLKLNGTEINKGKKISFQDGYKELSVVYGSINNVSMNYAEVRVTKADESYGVGVGNLAAHDYGNISANENHVLAFNVNSTIFDKGDTVYRISLYVRSTADGSWNEYHLLVEFDGLVFVPADEPEPTSETWIINEIPTITTDITSNILFKSNEINYSEVRIVRSSKFSQNIKYDLNNVYIVDIGSDPYWVDQAYRTVTFLEPPTGELLSWLQANAVKQNNDDLSSNSSDIKIELVYFNTKDGGVKYDNTNGWIDSAYRTITFTKTPTGNLLTWLQANATKQSIPENTWLINQTLTYTEDILIAEGIDFISNEYLFSGITIRLYDDVGLDAVILQGIPGYFSLPNQFDNVIGVDSAFNASQSGDNLSLN